MYGAAEPLTGADGRPPLSSRPIADGWSLRGNRFVKGDEVYQPLYEAKMTRHFDHRFGTYDGQTQEQANQGKLPELGAKQHADPNLHVLPRYWVPAAEVENRLSERWNRDWLLGWRDICRSTDKRTVIASVVRRAGVGDTFLLMLPGVQRTLAPALRANLTSFAFDHVARQKVGGTSLKYFTMKQLPPLPPAVYGQEISWRNSTWAEWLLPRVLELTYTAWELQSFAEDCPVPAPEEVYPTEPPELMMVAEPEEPYDEPGDAAGAEDIEAYEAVLSRLEANPGWHSRAEILADVELEPSKWNRVIGDLVETGEVEKKGERRGTRYRFRGTADQLIVAWLSEHPGWHSRAGILAGVDLGPSDWNRVIKKLIEAGEVERTGEKRGTRYRRSGPGR